MLCELGNGFLHIKMLFTKEVEEFVSLSYNSHDYRNI